MTWKKNYVEITGEKEEVILKWRIWLSHREQPSISRSPQAPSTTTHMISHWTHFSSSKSVNFERLERLLPMYFILIRQKAWMRVRGWKYTGLVFPGRNYERKKQPYCFGSLLILFESQQSTLSVHYCVGIQSVLHLSWVYSQSNNQAPNKLHFQLED